jgi:hypothetical protein
MRPVPVANMAHERKADHEQNALFDAGGNDMEGRAVEANDTVLGIPGYDREDVFSERVRWTELTPPEWRERHAHPGRTELNRDRSGL